MGFNKEKFLSSNLVAREMEVDVPDLKDWFDDGEKPVWKIKGLSGYELGRAEEAAQKNLKIRDIIEGILSQSSKKRVDAVKELAGVAEDRVPQDIAKRMEMLILGSIDPQCDYQLAGRICKDFPIEFYDITNKISQLTGQGHIPGKAAPSGKTKK